MYSDSPEDMDPPWSRAHECAAIAEGWDIFYAQGSSNGPWQIDEFDDPPAWADRNNGVVPPTLPSAEAAWKIVANGTQPHHLAARAFLQVHNPQEYDLVMKHRQERSQ